MRQVRLLGVGAEANEVAHPLPDCIRAVLESRQFGRSPTLRALLLYLWQNRNEPIGEYAIATEALGRRPNFDARIDATVRVQVSRLRQGLEKFYQHEGNTIPERLVIPLGTHQLQLETVDIPEPYAPLPPRRVSASGFINRRLLGACILLIALSAGLSIEVFRLARASGNKSVEQAPRFWKAFFGDGRQTRVILPNPIFFSYARSDASTLMVRDTAVNEFTGQKRSAVFGPLEKILGLGSARLAQNYTVTSDTFASISLVRYLDRFGLSTRVESSAEAPLEALDTENVVAIGTWGTLNPLRTYLDRMSLRLGPHEQFVEILSPGPGEPSRATSLEESPERAIWPGVVALLPGPGGKTRLLILASRQTSALVSALTSSNGLEQIERLWKSKGSPEFYEMLMNSEMNGSEMVRSWPQLLRPYRSGNSVTPGN